MDSRGIERDLIRKEVVGAAASAPTIGSSMRLGETPG